MSKTTYIVKCGRSYYDGVAGLWSSKIKAKRFSNRESALVAVDTFNCAEDPARVVKLTTKPIKKIKEVQFEPIATEGTIKELAINVVKAYFRGEADSHPDRFYDKMVALNNKIFEE